MKKSGSLVAVTLGLVLLAPLARAEPNRCQLAADDGNRARSEGKLGEANERFTSCAAEACAQPVRDACAKSAAEVAALRPSIVVSAKDEAGKSLEDVVLLIDGRVVTEKLDGKEIALDPGAHEITVTFAHRDPVTDNIVLEEGQRARSVAIAFGPPRGQRLLTTEGPGVTEAGGRSVVPWILIGAGAAIVVTGVIRIVTAPSAPSDCDAGAGICMRHPGESEQSLADRLERTRDADVQPEQGVALVAGGVVLAGAGLLWRMLEPTGPKHTGLRVAPFVGANVRGAGLSGSF